MAAINAAGVGFAIFVCFIALLSQFGKKPVADGLYELTNSELVLIGECEEPFGFMSDLSNYHMWFPGVNNMTEEDDGPIQPGKKYYETAYYPIIGDYDTQVLLTHYQPSEILQFMYYDWSQLVVRMTSQRRDGKCFLKHTLYTKSANYLYHFTFGNAFTLMYKLRTRHALFAIRMLLADSKLDKHITNGIGI